MNDSEIEYRVVWFPASGKDQQRTVSDESAAHALAEAHSSDAPLIERRTVTRSPWETIWNSAGPAFHA